MDDQLRHQLIVLCRRSSARILGWPRDWRPQQVSNPETGDFFTENGAWHFIADILEAGCAYEVITLREPPGKRAYVILYPLPPNHAPVYIKLELGSGCVIGRSFHLSTR